MSMEYRILSAPRPNREEHPYQAQLQWGPLRFFIENLKGSVRSGVSPDGHKWATTMPAHYGEVPNTVAIDGDPVDVFVGPHGPQEAPVVYVIHQAQSGGPHDDEPKCMVGFATAVDALATYRMAYDSKRPTNLGVTAWPWWDWAEAVYHPRTRLDEASGGAALSMASVPDELQALERRLRVTGRCKQLSKADQLELFQRAEVKAHTRKTTHGLQAVRAHRRIMDKASPSLRAFTALRAKLKTDAMPAVKKVAREVGAQPEEMAFYDAMEKALEQVMLDGYRDGKVKGAKAALREHIALIDADGQHTAASMLRQRLGLTRRRSSTQWRGDGAPVPGEKGYRAARMPTPSAWDGHTPAQVAEGTTSMAQLYSADPEFWTAMQIPASQADMHLWTQADIPDLIGMPTRDGSGQRMAQDVRIATAMAIVRLVQETDERGDGLTPDGYGAARTMAPADLPQNQEGYARPERHPLAMPLWLVRAIVADHLEGKAKGRLVNVSRETAAAFVEKHHSALPKLNERGIIYALGLVRGDRLVAVATAGTPTGRWDRGTVAPDKVLELTRVASDGTTRNAASQLTARLIRLLPESGRELFVTYSFQGERGSSYRALRQLGLRPTEVRRGKTQAAGSSRGGADPLAAKAAVAKIRWEAGPLAAMPLDVTRSSVASRTLKAPTRGSYTLKANATKRDMAELRGMIRADEFAGKAGLQQELDRRLAKATPDEPVRPPPMAGAGWLWALREGYPAAWERAQNAHDLTKAVDDWAALNPAAILDIDFDHPQQPQTRLVVRGL